MGNTFGQLFRVTTFGESHGGGIGVVVDGCPPRIAVSNADIQQELDRRRPGQSKITTQRKEPDRCEILSGVFEGRTLGTPITVLVRNQDARPEAYEAMRETFRPSHADFTYQAKYGIRDWQGGGRASARETIGRVAGGAIARKVLTTLFPKIEVVAFVRQIHQIVAEINRSKVKIADVEATIERCPDKAVAKNMVDLIEKTRADGDSLGGVIECVARNVPPGLGEPVFDKLEADLAKAMLSLPPPKDSKLVPGFSRRACAARNTMTPSRSAAAASAHARIFPAESKGEFPTARKFISVSPLSRPRQLRESKTVLLPPAKRPNLPHAADMIHASFRGPSRW